MKTLTIEMTLIEAMLGTAPCDPEIYRKFIAEKNKELTKAQVQDECDTLRRISEGTEDPDAVEEVPETITIFHKDENGNPFIYDYLVKGFFKNACSALRNISDSKSSKITAFKKKIDGTVMVNPRKLMINAAGPITILQRPLRASTAQGERIALAASECIPAGSTIECTIDVYDDKMYDAVIEWLNYGRVNGLGQWHNSGMGRFEYKILEEKKGSLCF